MADERCARLCATQATLHCLSRLHACLNVQITDQLREVGFERVVGRVVQFHTVEESFTPAISVHGVENRRELTSGFGKCLA